MPLGIQQNNSFLRLTLDVWQDKVFHNEREYPAGYFATAILNTPPDDIREMLRVGDTFHGRLFEVFCANKEELGIMLPSLKEQVQTLAELLLKHPPFCFHDKAQAQHLIDVMLSPESLNDLSRVGSRGRGFFLSYLNSIAQIPPAIYHFYAAGRFFELDYLRWLKKRDETFFAIAAHDCFNSESFWEEMHDLQISEIEPFTVTPELQSSYVFARHPNDEKKMVFVNRYFFEHLISFYTFDLMNGLHHGHAPSQCMGCGKYFLTTNGHKPKYCDGIAPQDPKLTCRQYGAKMQQKEQNKHHPVYRLHTTRTGTIRKHHERGKITDDERREALYLAETYRERALMDKNYADNGYERDMELEHIYAEVQKRLT